MSIKRQDHGLLNTAAFQVGQFVAQSGHAAGGEFGALGPLGKKVARMRLKSKHATGHAALLGFAAHEGNHGLMAPMHPIKIANG
jgi:hypothetical protein